MSTLEPHQLVGTWELVSFQVCPADGRPPRHPFGVSALGRIVYAADGHMMAVLSAPPQPSDSAGSLETSHQASEADKAAAFDRYLSYSGRWELEDDRVHHHVDLALAPGVVGQTLTRRVSMSGALLTLSYTRESSRGTAHRFELVWRRPLAGAVDART